ncbi:ABC transporter permease [Bradyrhizobium sp. Leo121]|uniref:ABC transporter permease n=1 Tax=Bradyrhizobium sp. Leo121 TaxID=1571195 RepID=UPI00102A854A|nr:ABC transporter permease [Bradyrhizobium sp. Leo121]RZN36143.1 sugar ABC transporter permease [Bradyrhizobium sp. Leo121]
MLKLERRATPSSIMSVASPLLAAVGMLITGFVLFKVLGKDPVEAFYLFFVKPVSTTYGIGELLLKTTPLLLCGLGLALGFRANVWNIGAEGQLTMGAIAGGGVALWFGDSESAFALPLMLLAGVLGGMAWAAIPAFLRTRFNTNEILVTLMLVYISQLVLSWLVHGPWRDPQGLNYPQSQGFGDAETMSILISGTRVTWGIVYALGLALVAWIFSQKTFAGFRMQVAGLAPAAAAYAGFSEKRNIWIALMICGATAGLAGVCEVAGPIGRLQQQISPGYGFAAIIVAWIGRLHPIGVVFGALLMSLLYLGGEAAQAGMGLPSAITGLFQGLLLFYLLAADLFITFQLKRVAPVEANTLKPPVQAETAA